MLFFWRKKKQTVSNTPTPSPEDINALLYKHNVELATKNKALSLLSHLYETSILTLEPDDLIRRITESVRDALNYESVAVFLYNKNEDTLRQIQPARSERYTEQLRLTGLNLDNIIFHPASHQSFFNQVMVEHKSILDMEFGFHLKDRFIAAKDLQMLAERVHLKATVVYPLALGGKTLGVLAISMNREYGSLPEYEKQIVGSIVNVISLAIDKSLTYRELQEVNEKLKELDKLKTEFLALASHQLRSPLTAIKGYTSMLLDGDFGHIEDKQKEAVNRVFESSVHLTKVVEDLLNVSKIESGGMQYQKAPFDMEKAAGDLARDLSISAQKKGLTLGFFTDKKGPYTVNGDMEKIRQVILNIIDNSIKYTQKGGISVQLAKNVAEKMIVLSITDTGMGISPEEKEKLFGKFARGEGGKTNTGGSGLGLYLAKTIIEAHGGHIMIDSPGVGKGSTFTIEFKAE